MDASSSDITTPPPPHHRQPADAGVRVCVCMCVLVRRIGPLGGGDAAQCAGLRTQRRKSGVLGRVPIGRADGRTGRPLKRTYERVHCTHSLETHTHMSKYMVLRVCVCVCVCTRRTHALCLCI